MIHLACNQLHHKTVQLAVLVSDFCNLVFVKVFRCVSCQEPNQRNVLLICVCNETTSVSALSAAAVGNDPKLGLRSHEVILLIVEKLTRSCVMRVYINAYV